MMREEDRERLRLTRGWLLQQPRPASLRLSVGTTTRNVSIQPNQSWADVAKTVVALDPDQIEALDDKGNIIRATNAHFGDDDELELEQHSARPTTPAPALDLVVPQDAESQRFALFARLLSDAYRHSTDVAFDRLAGIAEAQERRAQSLEATVDTMYKIERQRLERAYQDLEEREDEEEEERGKKGDDPIEKIIKGVAKHFGDDDAGDEPPAAEPPQPNGKAQAH